ncbi:MAG: aminotransferase class I/II-fold pyridoxal phosphate-dependent enzyme [Myxococcota bacterium]|nr:aminotransferase class I/II-fold pyridoxal phosphate-dependent enzyme [Myxococcota bacterium]
MSQRIYLSPPHMGGDELTFVQEAFATNWLSSVGPNLNAFEAEMEAYLGRPCVALGSGTAAIHLGLRLLGVGPGDEVVAPSLTFAATINPAVYQGATPVFVDSERTSWNLDPELLAELLAARAKTGKMPKAVVVVHLFGQTADMRRLREVCGRHDVPIFEDAAEALGADYEGTKAGALAPLAALSFNGNKIITTTGGGMLVAESRAAVEKVRFWSTQARDPGIAYEHSELGYNYRMSNVLAGIGRGQLQVLDERVAARRRIAFRYRERFATLGLEGLELMPQAPWGKHTNWLSVFTVDEAALGCSRDAIIDALGKQDIEARPVWKPMHLQKLYGSCAMIGGAVAEDLFARGVCLPSGSSLTDDEQDRVVDTIARIARERGRA